MSDFDKTVIVNFDTADAVEKCPVCNVALEPDEKQSGMLRCPVCRYSKIRKRDREPIGRFRPKEGRPDC